MAFESGLPEQLKKVKRNLSIDKISSLPDELLINILNFLPTKCAFITSTLSRRWSHLFKEVNNLDFDDLLMFRSLSAFIYKIKWLRAFKHETICVTFSGFIGNMMDSVKLSNLTRFRINCSEKDQSFDGKVESWLLAILSHGIEEIDLCFNASVNVPNTLFTCKTLCVLKLTSYTVLRLPQTVCLPRLKILHLKNFMVFEESCTDKIIPGCPLLRDFCLDVYPFKEAGQLSISAPSLTKLTLEYNKSYSHDQPRPLVAIVAPLLQYFRYGDTLAKTYSITTSSYLVEAHLDVTHITFRDVSASAISHSARELIQAVSKVKRLFLSVHCMEALTFAKDDLPILSRLTKLELGRSTILHVILPMLLEIAPCLEELIFKEGLIPEGFQEDNIVRQDYWEGHENVPSCLKTQVKVIEIEHFSGLAEELRMVEYFLSNSHSLAQVTIHKWIGIEHRFEVRKQLKRMARRWKKCVHFCDRLL